MMRCSSHQRSSCSSRHSTSRPDQSRASRTRLLHQAARRPPCGSAGNVLLRCGKAALQCHGHRETPLSASACRSRRPWPASSTSVSCGLRATISPSTCAVVPDRQQRTARATEQQTTLAESMPNDSRSISRAHNLGANLGWRIKNLLACSSAQAGGCRCHSRAVWTFGERPTADRDVRAVLRRQA